MFSLGLVAHFFFMLNNTETFLKDYAAWMEAKFKSVHLKNMKGMFFKQGCSALEQNLLARNHNFLLNIQPSYSPIFFWTLIYNVPQNITPFVYNWASVYSTYRQWFRSLYHPRSGISLLRSIHCQVSSPEIFYASTIYIPYIQ